MKIVIDTLDIIQNRLNKNIQTVKEEGNVITMKVLKKHAAGAMIVQIQKVNLFLNERDTRMETIHEEKKETTRFRSNVNKIQKTRNKHTEGPKKSGGNRQLNPHLQTARIKNKK